MDYLPLEPFEFDDNASLEDIIKVWDERGLWFFNVDYHEKAYFTIKQANGNFLKEQDGQLQVFDLKTSAEKYIEDKKLVDSVIVDNLYTYYTAQNENGRYIANTNGSVKEFRKKEYAMRSAINYNEDTIKIQQAAANYRIK